MPSDLRAVVHRDGDDAAVGGRFDGILQEVGEDRVAEELFTQREGTRAALDTHGDVLGRRVALEVRHDAVDDAGEVDCLRMQGVRLLLHLEQIEREIDHVQEAIPRALDHAEELRILRARRALLAQQARHRDDGVERRLQVVAGDAIDLLAQAHALAQRFLLRAPLRDVRDRRDEARREALLVTDRHAHALHPHVRAVGAAQAVFDRLVELPAVAREHVGAEGAVHARLVVGMDHVEVVGPAGRVRVARIAEKLLEAGRVIRGPGRAVPVDDAGFRGAHDEPEPPLLGGERLLDGALLGHVHGRDHDADRAAARVGHGRPPRRCRAPRAPAARNR